jgi:FHS family L-fucose permease-like MFS transporter
MKTDSNTKENIITRNLLLPFILLTMLFFAWAVPNNLTDTMLAAFKRIMSLSDSKTAWIQVVCYLLGYGCCAIPGALLIKKYTYKAGVVGGLSLYILGCFIFYPAKLCLQVNAEISFFMYLFAIFILFAGLSVLETSANSYVYAIGPEESATRRLNFSQSFNPFGAIAGVIISQVFILSQLNIMTVPERDAISAADLSVIREAELSAVTTTYVWLGVLMGVLLLAIILTRMPNLKEGGQKPDLVGTFKRLMKNKNYVWGVVAQFFYVGAQIAVWSFIIRYAMQQLHFDGIVASFGTNASSGEIIAALRLVDPVAGVFYSLCEWVGLDDLLPRTSEQAGATYYILSLILFVVMRFVCTWLMKYIRTDKLLTVLSIAAALFCLGAIYAKGAVGVYSLVCVSGCMSLMFPTIYATGVKGLGEDTKIGGAGMVMAIAGAAVLTQIQGILSDVSNIETAYWVPAVAFSVVAFYSITVCSKQRVTKGLCVVFLFLNLSFLSCDEKGKEASHTLELSDKQLHFSLQSNTRSFILALFPYTDPDGKEYLTFQNESKNEILFYDMETQNLSFTVGVEREGPNGVGNFLGYRIHNPDSIFLTRSGKQEISIVDRQAWLKDKIRYETTDDGYSLRQTYSLSNVYHPLVLLNGQLYIQPGCNRWADKKPLCAVIDLQTHSVRELPGLSYPTFPGADNRAKAAGVEEYVSRIFDGKHFVYSFHFKEDIYVASIDHQTVSEIKIKSRYINNIGFYDDYGNVTFENLCENPNYGNLLYDPYRNVYYRIAYPKTTIEQGVRGVELMQYGRKNFSIIILDKDFRVIGETLFPDYTYNSTLMFIRKDGLYISSSHYLNPEYSDDVLSFQKFDLVKK